MTPAYLLRTFVSTVCVFGLNCRDVRCGCFAGWLGDHVAWRWQDF
ncbi:hypothetical protein RISK_002095 [Rhodopirellula islandica]|uniref:Uncharacterized protein n=1 Tax=Rhodopirellula islandica TaxID=595434 RepID=A0A0J1BFZ3_RHOIS|nr:hypothetical protein RISK_002095 [Rhodopirellula islandica]